jgi:hypothetical protein
VILYPPNDCHEELWSKLDAEAIAREHGAASALLNGPHYWLLSAIEKATQERRRPRPSNHSTSGRPHLPELAAPRVSAGVSAERFTARRKPVATGTRRRGQHHPIAKVVAEQRLDAISQVGHQHRVRGDAGA